MLDNTGHKLNIRRNKIFLYVYIHITYIVQYAVTTVQWLVVNG